MDSGLIQQAQGIEETVQESPTDITVSLSSYIDDKWTAAKEAKEPFEKEMLQSIRQRRGEYDPEKLAEIKAAEQPEIFMNITDTKSRNAKAWIKDIMFSTTERIFAVDPTPVPELPQNVTAGIQENIVNQYINVAVMEAQQTGQLPDPNFLRQVIIAKAEEIKARVKLQITEMSKKMALEIADQIDDDWIEGGFYTALQEAIDDIVDLKAGIVKGPIFRKVQTKKSVMDETGRLTRQIVELIRPEYERRSPFSIYPSPRSNGVDAGYLFDVIIQNPKKLYALIGVDGFNEEEIRAVLNEFTTHSLKNDWLGLSEEAKEGLGEEKTDMNSKEENIYCLELWDEIPGSLLNDWGLEVPDPDDQYSCCVWKIGNHIIKAMLNYDSLGKKPFSITSFQKENDSFWGSGVPEKIKDCQQVCNAAARSILANVGIAALPQTDLNVDRLEPGASRKVWPGKVWPLTDEQMMGGGKSVNFYQPPMVTQQLTAVYHTFSQIADEHSGIPAYAGGTPVSGGAVGTSSGLHQLINQATRGVKAVVRNIDEDIIVNCLEMHYDYILDNFDIYGLVGDYKISAKGTAALIAKEQLSQRKIEFMQLTGSNPVDMQLIGVENRRKMLKEVAESLGLGLDMSEPIMPMQQPATAPQESPENLDDAGNPVQGTETRQFNQQKPKGQVSTTGNPGTAEQIPYMRTGA